MKNILNIHELSVNYEKTPVLWDVSLEIPAGKLIALIGPNGAGKTTLLKAILGLVKPIAGTISFFGSPLKKVRKKIAYVPQRESVDWDFPITVLDLVLMGCLGRKGFFRFISRKERQDAEKYLALVGLESFSSRQISQLSGGQQQRAFIARALMQEADLYLLDEPFIGIDSASLQTLISILKTLRDEGKTIVVVHHDLENVTQIFDWAILLNVHLVGYGPVSEVFTSEMIQKTYGRETFLFDEATLLSQDKTQGYT